MTAEFLIAASVGIAASVEDLARRTVSNWIAVAALVGGMACQIAESGLHGAGAAALGAVSGFGIFLIFYLLGGMGGGDVKLMAGFGALLGVERILTASFCIAILGALLAAAVIGVAKLKKRNVVAIPYAPAIVLGVWIVLMQGGRGVTSIRLFEKKRETARSFSPGAGLWIVGF